MVCKAHKIGLSEVIVMHRHNILQFHTCMIFSDLILGRNLQTLNDVTYSPKPSISDDTDGISKHRRSPITPTLKHDNTHRFPVLVVLIYNF